MFRLLGCRSQQEDLWWRPLLGSWLWCAASGRHAAMAGCGDLDPGGGEGCGEEPWWEDPVAADAAVHAEVDPRPLPPRRQLTLLHDPDRAPDGLRTDLLPGLHARERDRLLLRPREPGDGETKPLQRSGPCHRVAEVVSIHVAGPSSAVARMVRTDLRGDGGGR